MNFSKLVKTVSITALALTLIGCGSATNNTKDPQGNHNDPSQPFSQGPTSDPSTIKGPTSPPKTDNITTLNPNDQIYADTQHDIVKEYKGADGTIKKLSFTFNIVDGVHEGIILIPAFKGTNRENYLKLTKQTLYQKVDEIEIQPVPEIPQISQIYIEAFNEAVKQSKEQDNS